jgi:nicotinamidase-related amidase
MDLLLEGASLIMIDVQQAFDDPRWGMRNNPAAESNIARLLATWRFAGQPLFHVQHGSLDANSPLHPSAPGYAFKPQARPLADEILIHKSVNSAFIGTTLEQQLRDATASTLVIAGLTTDHCVSTTTRMAANLGFTVYLVGDACATFGRTGPNGARYTAAQMHDTALASLHGEFATVISSAEAVDQVG